MWFSIEQCQRIIGCVKYLCLHKIFHVADYLMIGRKPATGKNFDFSGVHCGVEKPTQWIEQEKSAVSRAYTCEGRKANTAAQSERSQGFRERTLRG